jgi:hypothetical protein
MRSPPSQDLEFRPKRSPVLAIDLAFAIFFAAKCRPERYLVVLQSVTEQRSYAGRTLASAAMKTCRFKEQDRRSKLEQPESNTRRRRLISVLKIVRFHQPAYHRPVLVALRPLRANEIRKRQNVNGEPVGQADGCATAPKDRERVDSPEGRHDIDAHPRNVRVMAAKLNGVSAPEVPDAKGWYRDHFGVECGERPTQSGQIRRVSEDDEIGIAAKLRRAVQHARLSAHEERPHSMLANRRKDSAYRVRDQENHPDSERRPRASRSPAIAQPG